MFNKIKTVTQYEAIPKTAIYLGSENGAGELDEFFYDLIADAEDPIRYRDKNGIHHYFNLIVLY
jgi:hypothetical protein